MKEFNKAMMYAGVVLVLGSLLFGQILEFGSQTTSILLVIMVSGFFSLFLGGISLFIEEYL